MPMNQTQPKAMEDYLLDGPIPGENYTSDTKNYPWHRPPEIDDMNVAVEKAMSELFSAKGVTAYANLLEMNATVSELTSLYVMNGIERGLWSVDYGLLLAGPVSRMIEIIGKMNGIDYEMGLPSPYGEPSRTFDIADEPASVLQQDEGEDSLFTTAEEAGVGGFMSGDMGGVYDDLDMGMDAPVPVDPSMDDEGQLNLF